MVVRGCNPSTQEMEAGLIVQVWLQSKSEASLHYLRAEQSKNDRDRRSERQGEAGRQAASQPASQMHASASAHTHMHARTHAHAHVHRHTQLEDKN